MDQTFGKEYKLCSKKLIDEIFNDGERMSSFPFSISFKETTLKSTVNFQIVISVPKRIFKHAVNRNRIKRLIRESVRKNKLILETTLRKENKQIALILIYRHKDSLDYAQLERKTKKAFLNLTERLSKES